MVEVRFDWTETFPLRRGDWIWVGSAKDVALFPNYPTLYQCASTMDGPICATSKYQYEFPREFPFWFCVLLLLLIVIAGCAQIPTDCKAKRPFMGPIVSISTE
jgi:hypothetical protein